MKGKRHTTEQKIRVLREADGGKSIASTRAKGYHSTWPSFREPLRFNDETRGAPNCRRPDSNGQPGGCGTR